MHPMRQDKGQRIARKRAHSVADVLHGVAAEVDLNLEVLMSMRAGFGAAALFVANVKVGEFTALLHDIGGDTAG